MKRVRALNKALKRSASMIAEAIVWGVALAANQQRGRAENAVEEADNALRAWRARGERRL